MPSGYRRRRRLIPDASSVARLVDQPAESTVKLAKLLAPVVREHIRKTRLTKSTARQRGSMKPRAPGRYNTKNYKFPKNRLKNDYTKSQKGRFLCR